MEIQNVVSLTHYLTDIKSKGNALEFLEDSQIDPKTLQMNRISYFFQRNEKGELFPVIGGSNEIDNDARESVRKSLDLIFRKLQENPFDLESLVKYAEELNFNGYIELSEPLLGKALTIAPEDPGIYQRFSRIHINAVGDGDVTKPRNIYHLTLASLLAEKGLELIDKIASDLMNNLVHVTGSLGQDSERERYLKLLYDRIPYSSEFIKHQQSLKK